MAKARAIVKRRKAVRNIKKITKTMQMIATAKFQKSLKRAVATKPYTLKVRELVAELAESLGGVESLIEHPGLMTHASIPAAMRASLGISDSLIRLSVGVEDVTDLTAELREALG